MAKPWARLEIGYLDHPKFLALTANAICLWHEGKNYCEKFHTDGLIPKDALKLFRFAGQKSVAMLLTGYGQKPDGTPYKPLWEKHPVGYKMHDYLVYNDCREEVLARLDDADDIAELRREANKRRQGEYRERRKAEVTALRNAGKSVTWPTPTETVPVPETVPKEEEQKQKGTAVSAETASGSPPAVVFLEFPTDGTPKIWPLTELQVSAWVTAYPSLDVKAECTKALAWVNAAPSNRKTAGGMPRFLVNWLNRATNRGGSAPHTSSRRPAWAQ